MSITEREYRKLLQEIRETKACCCRTINTVDAFGDLPDAASTPEERLYVVKTGAESGVYLVIDGVWVLIAAI